MTKLNAARERTDAKLRYAGVHLRELKIIRHGGSDFDKAHQESFLFHLFGVRDALLQEMNFFHSCGLPIEKVSRWKLEQALKTSSTASPALNALVQLEDDPQSWLSCLSNMRHHSIHRKNVGRVYYLGRDDVFLKDPRNNQEIPQDFVLLFDDWFSEMEKLVKQLRGMM